MAHYSEALQNVSNHHPLANGQSTLPQGWSPTQKYNMPGGRFAKAYTGQSFDIFNEDIENFPGHHKLANGQVTLPRGWSPTGKSKTPTKAGTKSYTSLSTRVKSVNHGIRREISKSHGDLSNVRPKSPLKESPFTPRQPGLHDPHAGTATEIRETGQVKAYARDIVSPCLNGKTHRQNIPSAWMSTVLRGRSPEAVVPNQVVDHQDHLSSPLAPSKETSCQLEKNPVPYRIRGLSSVSCPMDFCIPITRPHPDSLKRHDRRLHQATLVEQVDITNTWHGIRWSEAEELFRIDTAFTQTLERLLTNELHRINLQMRQEQSPNAELASPLTGVIRGISFCRQQLVSEMAEALYSSEEDMVKSQSGLLRLYLAVSDCLVQFSGDGPRDTSITVRVSRGQGDNGLNPVVEAGWVPDTITFKDLQDFPREGQAFILIPQYHSKSAFNSTRTPTNIRYSIESRQASLSWLSWNDDIAGFKGVVPLYSQDPDSRGCFRNSPRTYHDGPYAAVKTLCMDVKAVLIDGNGSSIVYERVLSARLSVNILPWYSQSAAHNLDQQIQASSNQSRGFAPTKFNVRARFEAHAPYAGFISGSRPTQKPVESFAGKLQDYGHQSNERQGQSQGFGGLPTVATTATPSDLATLAESYASLAAKYAELANHHRLVELQAQLLSPAQPFPMAPKDGLESLVQSNGNYASYQFCNPHAANRRSASGSSIGSELTNHAKRLSLDPPSLFISEEHTAQSQSPGLVTKRVVPALSVAPRPLLPSQEFDGLAWTRVDIPLKSFNETDQRKLKTQSNHDVIPMQTLTPAETGSSIMSAQEEVEYTVDRKGKGRVASDTKRSSPRQQFKQVQKKPRKIDDSVDSDITVSDSGSDKVTSSAALEPGIMCYNSFAPLAHSNPRSSPSTEQLCSDLDTNSRSGEATGHESKDDDPRRRIDSGYYTDLASFARLPTPARSSVNSSRNTSGSLDINSGSDDFGYQKYLHNQAASWCGRTQFKESHKRYGQDKIAKADVDEPRLSADEKKAMDEAMQRSIDEMVGKYDDVFLEDVGSGAGFDGSTESEEV